MSIPDSKKYILAPNDDYGWYTGRTTDNRQALMGLDVNAEICVLFDANGEKLESIERCFDRDGNRVTEAVTDWPFHLTESASTQVMSRFEHWLQSTIAKRCPITIKEFGVDNRFIGIEPMPSDYAEYLANPTSIDDEDRNEMPTLIEDWLTDNLYVFWWNEDYWMNPDGSVNSH